jgi:asparagine synthase (glutamine-hydrolysing)
MCGISGIFGIEKINDPRKIVEVMNHAMAHRGPDADGIYQGSNVVLGHRRLSIIDLSAESNQPFFSDDKRYCIVLTERFTIIKNFVMS